MQILLTRPLSQVNELQNMLIDNGYQPLLFPSLIIHRLKPKLIKTNFNVIIFISVNAVDYGIEYLKQIYNSNILIATVGMATKKRLEYYGFKVDITPTNTASSESLLAMPKLINMAKQHILIIRGNGGRETLKKQLSAANTVEYLEVYSRKVASVSANHKTSLDKFINKKLGCIMINSIDTLDAFLVIVNNINPDYMQILQQYLVIAFSPRVAKAVVNAGFNNYSLATTSSNYGMVAALEAYY